MNKLESMLLTSTGGPLNLKIRVAKKMPLPQKCYLWACIVFGVITLLPLLHYMSRWQEVNEITEDDLIRLSKLVTSPNGTNLKFAKSQELEEGLVYSGQVIKSVLDSKTYTTTVLDNGLRVLLVSDPQANLAAASCDVAVGSFHDPPNIPGLAHLLEHGVYLGDSTHKDSNTFEAFLSEQSGHSNAFTSQENTNFYYKVSTDKLEESLDRFSSLLSSPSLQLPALQREYHAIQSEFLKDKLESVRRVWRLVKHLASPTHSFHRLSPGNLETLQNLHNASTIREFHEEHYHAENMKCVVVGREDPQDLGEMTRKYLGRIRARKAGREGHEGEVGAPAYPAERLGVWVDYEPLREGSDLDVVWPVTGSERCGLGSAVHVLSARHTGSLLHVLKRQGLATTLSWNILISTTSFTLLRLNIKLTRQGSNKVSIVTKMLFAHIELLLAESPTNTKLWLDQMYQESLQNFINHEEPEVHHFAKTLSSRMRRVIHPAHYLGAPIQTPSVSCLTQALGALRLEQGIFLFGVSSGDIKYRSLEPWYEVPYTTTPLSASSLTFVRALPHSLLSSLSAPPTSHTKLPKTFPLFPRDLDQGYWPTKVQGGSSSPLTVWWQQDYTFHVPRIELVLWVFGRAEHFSAHDVALHYLLAETVRDRVEDLARPPGYSVQIHYQGSSGLVVSVSGYSDHVTLSRIISQTVSVMVALDTQSNRFEHVVKYRAHRDLARSHYAEAYKHPLYKSRVLLEQNVAPLDQILSELDRITHEEFSAFHVQFWRGVGCRALVYGNVLKDMAEHYSTLLQPLVARTPAEAVTPPFHPTLKYPAGTYYTITQYPNLAETASVADLTIILGPTPWGSNSGHSGRTGHSGRPGHSGRAEELFARTVLGRLAATMLSEPAFIELRTKQQLGYSVFTRHVTHFGIDYIHLCVQGSEHSATRIASSVLEFLRSYRTTLASLITGSADSTHWDSAVASVRRDILVTPSSQHTLAAQLAAELFSPDSEPDRADMLIAALERLTPHKLLKFYDEYILGARGQRIISLAQSQTRAWNLEGLKERFHSLDLGNKTQSRKPWLYWHFTYLGLEMGK